MLICYHLKMSPSQVYAENVELLRLLNIAQPAWWTGEVADG